MPGIEQSNSAMKFAILSALLLIILSGHNQGCDFDPDVQLFHPFDTL